MSPDLPVHRALVLYADRIRETLAAHAMTAPRVAGLVGAGRPVSHGVPVEIYVEVAGAHDHYAAGMPHLDREVADLIGCPVIVTHRQVGQERPLPDASVWLL